MLFSKDLIFALSKSASLHMKIQQSKILSRYLAIFLLVCGLFNPHVLFAVPAGTQINIIGGLSRTMAKTNMVAISTNERDLLKQDDNYNTFRGIGLSYVFKDKDALPKWLPSIIKSVSLGFDYVNFNAKSTGHVLLYGIGELSNYHYTLRLNTNRLMLKSQWALPKILKSLTPYVRVSAGLSNMNFYYIEDPKEGEGTIDGDLQLEKKESTRFVYSLGAGVIKSITPHVDIQLGYLYTHFNSTKSSIKSSDLWLINPIKAQLSAHSLYLAWVYTFT